MAEDVTTARWIDRVWTVASGLLIVVLAGMTGIGVKVYDQAHENALHLENVIKIQGRARQERDAIIDELKNRSDRWMTKESAQTQFSSIMNALSDHEQRLRAIERINKARLNLFKLTEK